MQIISIFIYPIKSLGGIAMDVAQMEGRGLAYDRRWMLVDTDGMFISQRKESKLALFQVAIEEENLLVTNKASEHSIAVPFAPSGDQLDVQIWDDRTEANEVSKQISQWFSTELGFETKLVYMSDSTRRSVDPEYAPDSELVSFADGYPVLVANKASLEDLNERLEAPIRMGRFRPNIVVNGKVPFEEDHWKAIQVGVHQIQLVKRCARCIMINIDPETSERKGNVLNVLSDYRKQNNKVYFGMNGLIPQSGEIRVGDEVKVIEV